MEVIGLYQDPANLTPGEKPLVHIGRRVGMLQSRFRRIGENNYRFLHESEHRFPIFTLAYIIFRCVI
jgi:hypothetical protein